VVLADVSSQPDFVIIGGGPAGYGAALAAANTGASVVLVDAGGLGGTCLQRGCIPAKYFLEAASVFHGARHASRFGISMSEPEIDFAVAQTGKGSLVTSIATGLAKLLKLRGVQVISGFGQLETDHRVTVTVGDERTVFSPKFVILATGSKPRALDAVPVDQRRIVVGAV
jgi:dihydrolipoamide dehydrogenase